MWRGMGYGVWGMGYGVWGMGYGVWGMGYGVWGMQGDSRATTQGLQLIPYSTFPYVVFGTFFLTI